MRDAYHIFDTSKILAASNVVTDSANVCDFKVVKVSQSGTALALKIASTKEVTALAGNLHIKLVECATSGGTYTDLMTLKAVSQATLGSYYSFPSQPLPSEHKQFLKLTYQVTGVLGTNNAYKAWLEAEK